MFSGARIPLPRPPDAPRSPGPAGWSRWLPAIRPGTGAARHLWAGARVGPIVVSTDATGSRIGVVDHGAATATELATAGGMVTACAPARCLARAPGRGSCSASGDRPGPLLRRQGQGARGLATRAAAGRMLVLGVGGPGTAALFRRADGRGRGRTPSRRWRPGPSGRADDVVLAVARCLSASDECRVVLGLTGLLPLPSSAKVALFGTGGAVGVSGHAAWGKGPLA